MIDHDLEGLDTGAVSEGDELIASKGPHPAAYDDFLADRFEP